MPSRTQPCVRYPLSVDTAPAAVGIGVDPADARRLKWEAKQLDGTRPLGAWELYRALNDAHVPFASNAVTVRGGEGGSHSHAAAAISTVPPPTPLAPAPG